MKPTIAINRVVLYNPSNNGNPPCNQTAQTRAKLIFYICPIGTSDHKKIEMWQIRITDHDGEVLPVYHDSVKKLDNMGFMIGGKTGARTEFRTKYFEVKKDYKDASIQLILVDKSNNLGHRYKINLKDGVADTDDNSGSENPIKLLELKEGITFAR